jgi:putative MFS transporter
MEDKSLRPLFTIPVIVAALGYFVDIYDLLLFGIVRVPSLRALGVVSAELQSRGEFLINIQMIGLLIGGIIWGIMGDKKGRLSVLFGSILLYSLANIANGFVTTVGQYAGLRLIAGIGLAGELGAGITLVTETLPVRLRSYATTIVASVGILGAVFANFIAREFDWRICYYIGGGLGVVLLLARISVFESGIFLKVKEQNVRRGNFFQLFTRKKSFTRFLGCIFIGLPTWYVIGILVTFSPEFSKAIGVSTPVLAGDAIMYCYIGITLGGFASGFISEAMRSRRKVVLLYLALTFVFIILYLFNPFTSSVFFYWGCFLLGVGVGYWAIFVTIAAEQFGTNLRSTVATTVPNFIRGALVPLVYAFRYMRLEVGVIYGALCVGVMTIAIALIALRSVDETFGRDLNFVEEE